MPKCVKTEELPAPESPEAPPRKHSRKDAKVEQADDVVDVDLEPEQESNGSSPDHGNEEEDAPKDSGPLTRDPDYYFADGSVVVRIGDVLFKVHTSLLGAHSEVFREMFNVPVGGECTEGDEPAVKQEDQDNDEDKAPNSPRGTSDDHPIVIDVMSEQFRNLLRVIYCLPSDDSVAILERNASGERGYARFDLLVAIATLSRQFSIPDLEKWAVNQLEGLLESHTETIGSYIGELGDIFDWLVLILDGAKAATPHLVSGLRYLIQYSCCNPDPSEKSLVLN